MRARVAMRRAMTGAMGRAMMAKAMGRATRRERAEAAMGKVPRLSIHGWSSINLKDSFTKWSRSVYASSSVKWTG